MMEHPEFDKSASSSIGLWWSDGKVVGAAIYDMYFGEAFCGALPEYEALYPEILDYAYRELKDDDGLAVAINEENTAEIRAALQAGFERIEQKETIMALSLNRDFSSILPEGRNALEWLFWQGFDHGDDREAFERSLDHVPHVRRHFNKALCLSAADLSGEPVSHCSLWFHPDTDYAYVEPVCTIPRYRGKGIAATLLSEAFSRAKALGAKKAYVISDLPFYEKLGFEKTQQYTFYRQDGVQGIDYAHKDAFQWISVIRLPDFVTADDFAWAVEEATRKKKTDFSKAEFLTYDEGLCVQCLHAGSYDDEPATVARMHEYMKAQGYVLDITSQRMHHEIYLSDARKVAPEKLKTVIRHPIRKG